MKTVEEVRRIRLKMLVNEAGGTLADLNRITGKSDRDSTYSQILNQSVGSKTDKPKTMGSPLARSLEQHCGKPTGWMDTDPDISDDAWPFPSIQKSNLLCLDKPDSVRLEAALRMVARELGLDIEGNVAREASRDVKKDA